MSYKFLRASYGPQIGNKLSAKWVIGGHDAVAELRAMEEPAAAKALERIAKAGPRRDGDFDTVFDCFAKKTDPRHGRDGKYLGWICKSFLEDPVRPEDWHKIRENLRYFETLSTVLHRAGKPNRIEKIDGFRALDELVSPYAAARDFRAARRAERHMAGAEKQKILSETTVLYDGPEGRVVMPHTVQAAQYWGSATKWCISAREEGDNAFNSYNEHTPVVIYLPKPALEDCQPPQLSRDEYIRDIRQVYSSFKFAAVHGCQLYNEFDRYVLDSTSVPPCLQALAAAADAKRTGAESSWMRKYAMTEKIASFRAQTGSPIDAPLPKEVSAWIEYGAWFEESESLAKNIPRALFGEKGFLLHVIPTRAAIMKYAAPALHDDRDFVLEAVRKNGYAYTFLQNEDFKRDPEIGLAALKGDRSLSLLHKDRKWNDGFLTDAICAIGPHKIHGPLNFECQNMRNHGQERELLSALERRLSDVDSLLGIHCSQMMHIAALSGANGDRIWDQVLRKGHGLDPKFRKPFGLNDHEYCKAALRIALANGAGDTITPHLRLIPALRGNLAAMISPGAALERLEEIDTAPGLRVVSKSLAF